MKYIAFITSVLLRLSEMASCGQVEIQAPHCVQSAKLIGAGLATIGLAGPGMGAGTVFAGLLNSVAYNPFLKQQLATKYKQKWKS